MSIVQALIEATRHIDADYFQLPIAGRTRPIKRERVYCYELYHQLRLALRASPLTLTGEPDKRGHPDFGRGAQPNPDFILHTPGHHRDNSAVVEVECRLGLEHLIKDFRTLKLMKSKGYTVFVLLIFAVRRVPWPRLELAAAEAKIRLNDVILLHHRTAGESAVRVHPHGGNAT